MTTTAPGLSPSELQRYARHITLPQVGVEGQRRLKAARVLLVGVGGLGSPAALYLASAGIGTLGLVDHDAVDLSNLQRQVLHGTSAIGTSKLESATKRLHDLNPHVRLTAHGSRLTSSNAMDIVESYDVVVDGSDNFPTRYLVSDVCALLGKPDVYGSIHRFEGQVSVFWTGRGPCYRCLYREPPPPELVPSCEEGGVLGVLPGIVGSLQAAEAIKIILGVGASLVGRLLLFDALAMSFRELALERDPECPVCGERPSIRQPIDYDAFCAGQPGAREQGPVDISPKDLEQELSSGRKIVLLDVREQWEFDLCHLPGSVLIPLSELPERLTEVGDGAVVTICHQGGRASQATGFLKAHGRDDVRTLVGGVDGWAAEVDPEMERY